MSTGVTGAVERRAGMSEGRDLVMELEAAGEGEPCRAVLACHALYTLGLGDEEVRAAWPKLAGRPSGRVRAFLTNLKEEREELWMHHISAFAKQVEAGDGTPA